jgi:Winged helix DNA-binding domain
VTISGRAASAWRLTRQHLDPVDGTGALEVTRRLCGVQAQVPSAAALAVAVRQAHPDLNATSRALATRTLVRTWAMRGTLHLLPAAGAADVLSLLASAHTWEKGSWQKSFASIETMETLAQAVWDALADGSALTREKLVERVLAVTGDDTVVDHLRSGWGPLLKPLAWQGILFQGPSGDQRVTFVRPDRWLPDWPGLPDPDEAAGRVIEAYLGAFGPATPEAFDQWLLRGATPRPRLRAWFQALGDAVTAVDVDGATEYARTADLDQLTSIRPGPIVRLLPAFDQYVLGPGTADDRVVPAAHRAQVSRAAGWIAPVLVHDGRVTGTWAAEGGRPVVTLFDPAREPPPDLLEAETTRVATLLQQQPLG